MWSGPSLLQFDGYFVPWRQLLTRVYPLQAVSFARQRLQSGMDPRAICEAMCDACLAPDTGGCGKGCDNMSAMIVILKQFASSNAEKSGRSDPPVLWKS